MMTRSRPITTFAKVRRDHATETAEDYVEAISDIVAEKGACRVRDLAAFMGVSHVTVTRIVSRLQGEALLETAPYRPIHLTARGEQLALRCRRRHELVVAFLRQLGVPEDAARRDAEGIEHHVGKETLACMRQFIDQHGE